jgi:hypothetical protein
VSFRNAVDGMASSTSLIRRYCGVLLNSFWAVSCRSRACVSTKDDLLKGSFFVTVVVPKEPSSAARLAASSAASFPGMSTCPGVQSSQSMRCGCMVFASCNFLWKKSQI